MKRRLVTAAFASLLLMSVITPMPAEGQATSASEVKQRAEQLGHSHVDVWEVAGRHRVGFQNRRHRDEGRAVHELLESIDASPPRFSLTGRARGIDIYSVNLDDDAVSVVPAPAGSADSQPFLVDLVIHPFFGALLGSYSQPVRARTGIAPEIAVYPWKGGRISAQVEFVAVDDVSLNPKRIEPGLMSVSQWARIPVGRTYAAGGAGLFSSERYGLYADVQSLFLDGRIALHGSAAYTGFAALESKTWYVSSLNRVQALAGIEYVHPGLAASVLIRGGQFLDEDRGVRVDVRRAFGGFQIGFSESRRASTTQLACPFAFRFCRRGNQRQGLAWCRPVSSRSNIDTVPTEGASFGRVTRSICSRTSCIRPSSRCSCAGRVGGDDLHVRPSG
jgi:hypothetical protein